MRLIETLKVHLEKTWTRAWQYYFSVVGRGSRQMYDLYPFEKLWEAAFQDSFVYIYCLCLTPIANIYIQRKCNENDVVLKWYERWENDMEDKRVLMRKNLNNYLHLHDFSTSSCDVCLQQGWCQENLKMQYYCFTV